jgi:hypothetical protein
MLKAAGWRLNGRTAIAKMETWHKMIAHHLGRSQAKIAEIIIVGRRFEFSTSRLGRRLVPAST